MVVIDLHSTVVEVGRQCRPTVEAVINRLGRGTAFGHTLAFLCEPCMQILTQRLGIGLPYCQAILHREALDLALNPVQRGNALDGLCAHRAEVVTSEFFKLASGMRKTARADALGLVDDLPICAQAIADQRARPARKECKRLLGPSAQAELINHAG